MANLNLANLPIINAQNGPLLPVNYCRPPKEGARICPLKMTFPPSGAIYNVSINQGGVAGGSSISQISAMFVDNTRSNQIVTIQIPDSGQLINVPGYTRTWVNILTGGLGFFVSMVPDNVSAVVEIHVCNFNVVESSNTITFIDGLEEVFTIPVTNNPNPPNFDPGMTLFFAGAPPGYFTHFSTISMQRINWRVLQTTGIAGQGERWLLQDSSNGGNTLAQMVFQIVTASLTIYYNDFAPYYQNANFNYLTGGPDASLWLINAGQSKYDGTLTFSLRYSYYNFPTIT